MKPVWRALLLSTSLASGIGMLAACSDGAEPVSEATPTPAETGTDMPPMPPNGGNGGPPPGGMGPGRSLQNQAVDIKLADPISVPETDAQNRALAEAAQAFLATLSDDQRDQVVYAFDDNTQRSNWSNFPDGMVERGGIKRGDLTEDQLNALNALLGVALSEEGLTNVNYQLAADDALSSNGGANFGSQYYYVSFLGEPSTDAPWMMQFGGHHLAINTTIVGSEASFSPMLTGGQPLRINYEGEPVFIVEKETAAAQKLMDSLDTAQKEKVIISDSPINLVLGPGEFGTSIAPEGIKISELNDSQKALLLDVITARLEFLNADDFADKMEVIKADLDESYFGWWGPEGTLGAAYHRFTAPTAVIEYSPQALDGDMTNHSHAMYRNPKNDYGVAWISAK